MLRLLRDVKCLDLISRDQLIQQIASVQILSPATKAGQPPIHAWRKVRGLFFTPGWPVLRDTYLSLSALEILDGLDTIDRKACIDGILRLHHGKGFFASSALSDHHEIQITGNAQDTFYAFESLRILGGLDRVKDLDQWKFRPDDRGYKSLPNWNDIEAWLCQQRLAKILADRKANPQAAFRSLRDP
jgi:prenyltransferase beta subunit